MKELTAFQAQAASIALMKIFKKGHFDICSFDALAKSIGSHVGGPDYDALRNLHCVDWAEMPKEMREMAKEKIVELLGLPPTVLEMEKPAKEPDVPMSHPERRAGLKLAFWK